MSMLPWSSVLLRGRERTAFFRYGMAVLSVGLSLLAGLSLRPYSYRSPNLFFYAPILFSLLSGGLGAGIASTILSALAVNYFFFPPYDRFSFDPVSIFNGVYFCLSFGFICWLIDTRWERAEGERRESEERLRIFVEHAPAALAMFDREMRYLHVSRRWRADYGLLDRDLSGVSHYEIFPEVPEHWKQAHRRALVGEVLREENDRFDRADGSVQWIRWEIRPWRDRTGGIGGIVIFADDISERKRSEEARERLAAVVDSSDDAIIAKTLDGTINAWNSGAEKVFGYSSAEAVGKPILMLLPPERASEEADILARIRQGESVQHFETIRIRRDSQRIEVSVTISPIRDSSGAIVGASKIARDISERKRTEELIRESERNYRTLFESMDEGFCTIEVLFNENNCPVDYRFLEVNPVFEELTGIPNARGRRMREIAPNHEQYWFEIFGKIALTGEPTRFEDWAGQLHRWYEVHAFRIGEPQERKVAIFFDDITKRKGAEEALRTSEEQFRTMANTIPQLVWMANADGWIFWYNQGWYDYTGTTPQQMEGWGWQSVHDPAELPRVMERWQASIVTGEPFEMTFPLRSAQGEFRSFLTRVAPVNDGSGKVLRWFGTNTDVEERQRTEAALRESEARLNDAQHTAHVGSWRFRPDGTVTWSDEGYELYKLPRGVPVTYEAVVAVMHPEDRERSRNAFLQQLESSALNFRNEYRVVWPDGQVRHLFSLSKIHRDHDGRLIEVVGTVQDVTERKESEAKLREYARVVEGLEEMILVVDRDYRYVIANHAFLNFRGMTSEQVIGHLADEVVGSDVFANEVKGKMDECFLGKVVQYEMTYNFQNLGNRDLFVSYFPIEGSAGIDRIACVLQDITERKLSEEALHKSEERFSKAFRNNPLAISISTEAEGLYLDVNDAFLDLLGFQRKDVIGRTATELQFWGEPLDRMEILRELKEEKKISKHHTRYRTAKGEIREAEVWMESVELDGQRCLLGITRDVTEMQQLEAQFRQAQKMEAVGRLAGGVAHDFNNILGIIMGYSDIALGEIPADSPASRYMSEAKKAAKRGASLTQQLLAFSRKQVVFPKVLDLNEVVQNAIKMFLRLVGEDIAVEFRPGVPLGGIRADPGQIEQILMNLVVNARDAMPTGGKIIIETGHAEMDENYVSRYAGAHAGLHVVLVVSDTGCGMNETTRSKIFEPFFTTKEVGKGTRLGLSTVYGIVKQSEGYIAAYSELGKGTTFKIYFPMVGEKGTVLAVGLEDTQPPQGSETILVVEDEKNLREVTVTLLQQGGYRVLEAKDAKDALKVMDNSEQGIDLLLTDVVMPEKSGAELAREARERYPKLRCLFMSGYTGDLVTRQGVVIEETSFLEKPFTKRALLMKVYLVLHSTT